MERIFEIEYIVMTVKNMNNVYVKAFHIKNFKIDGVEQECEHCVSHGYINFKDEVKKLKRKYLYNKLKDKIFVFQIIDGQTKICQPLSSSTVIPSSDHILETEKRLYEMYGNYLKDMDPETIAINFIGLDEGETNFTTKGCLDALLKEFEKENKGGKIMEGIKNVFVNEKEGVTVIVFNNGDKVRVTREKGEKNDIEKAIAIAIIKYYFGLDYYINACDKVVKAEKKEKVKKTVKKTNKKEEK